MADDIDTLLNEADSFIINGMKTENRKVQNYNNMSLDLRFST